MTDSQEIFKNIFESASDGIIYLDKKGIILDVNEKAAKIYGWPKKDLLGRHFKDVGIFSGKDLPPILKNFAEALAKRKSTLRLDITNKKGQRITLECLTSRVRDGKKTTGLVVIARDITKRVGIEEALQAREEQLRLTSNQVPAVLWTTDTELKFTSSTGAGLDALGLKTDQVVGMTLFEYFKTDDPKLSAIKAHRQALKGKSAKYEFDWEGRVFDSHVKPLHDTKSSIIGTIGFALDITERKKLEKELSARVEELEKWQRLTVGREIKMIELKKRVKELEKKVVETSKK
jgi:PAS domain S-box-containing protein